MKEKDFLELLTSALLEARAIKKYKKYQGDKGVQVITQDDTHYNILPVIIADKECSICKEKIM